VSRKRLIFAAVFVVVSLIGVWARYASEQAERRKREQLFRQLSLNNIAPELGGASATPTPTPPPEPRDMFDSTLPQESLELVGRAVGGDFKLMELSFGEELVTAKVSADAATVQHYALNKHAKNVEGPQPVQVIGEGKLADSLYERAAVDLALVPRLSKEALERAALPDAKVTRVSLAYPLIRRAGEGPEWTVFVERGKVNVDWQYKFVTFDTRGKFKRIS